MGTNDITSFKGKYEFLSNFYMSPVSYGDIEYPSVEHAYQALKTLNLETRQTIANLATPGKAKKAGKSIELRPEWESIKQRVMLSLLLKKFHDPILRQMLLDTGDAELVEGNWWGDTYWGQCPVGTGHNVLGRLLMAVRAQYQSEISGD